MDVMTTSGTTDVAHAKTLREEWARFGAFLKRPVLPDMAPMPRSTSLVAILRLLVLDLIVMSLLLAIGVLVTANGIKLPETALAGMELTPGLIIAAVLAAPLMEEAIFRSWISGRLGHILALVAGLLVGLVTTIVVGAKSMAGAGATDPAAMLAIVGHALVFAVPAGVIASLPVLYIMRGRPAMRWFSRAFPIFYWLSTILFAAAHLSNFAEGNTLTLIPLVLPQFSVGLILGYARVNYGLWSNMLLHLLHNGAFIGLVLLANAAA
jgi:membrane protease YdiL (CAAX protease family)